VTPRLNWMVSLAGSSDPVCLLLGNAARVPKRNGIESCNIRGYPFVINAGLPASTACTASRRACERICFLPRIKIDGSSEG